MVSKVIWNACHSIPTCFQNYGIPKLKWHNSTPQLEIWEIFDSNAFSCICDRLVKFSPISTQIP
jgi:hypothetical protein